MAVQRLCVCFAHLSACGLPAVERRLRRRAGERCQFQMNGALSGIFITVAKTGHGDDAFSVPRCLLTTPYDSSWSTQLPLFQGRERFGSSAELLRIQLRATLHHVRKNVDISTCRAETFHGMPARQQPPEIIIIIGGMDGEVIGGINNCAESYIKPTRCICNYIKTVDRLQL
jgi:hypothetical protein